MDLKWPGGYINKYKLKHDYKNNVLFKIENKCLITLAKLHFNDKQSFDDNDRLYLIKLGVLNKIKKENDNATLIEQLCNRYLDKTNPLPTCGQLMNSIIEKFNDDEIIILLTKLNILLSKTLVDKVLLKYKSSPGITRLSIRQKVIEGFTDLIQGYMPGLNKVNDIDNHIDNEIFMDNFASPSSPTCSGG